MNGSSDCILHDTVMMPCMWQAELKGQNTYKPLAGTRNHDTLHIASTMGQPTQDQGQEAFGVHKQRKKTRQVCNR